jgi:serine/threonine protein kinase
VYFQTCSLIAHVHLHVYHQTNILVNDKHEACLADFGLSRVLGESGFTTTSVGGTSRWMACELIMSSNEEGNVPQVTAASDVWAFSMTVLEVR